MTADIIVLGAGPTGVAAAMRAAREGHDVVVIEREDQAGGAAGSFEIAGLRVDYGSHRLHAATDPSVLAALRDLLGPDLQWRRRNGRIRLKDTWLRFPLKGANLVRHLPPSFTLGAARDAALSWTRRPSEATFASVMQASLGPTLCERFYFPYVRKLWGLEPHQISPELARRRVSALTATRLLRRLAPGRRAGFWYPRRGYGQISETLANEAAAAGARFYWGAAATRIELAGNDGAVVELDGGERVSGRKVWSTAPVTTLLRMLEPTPPSAVRDAAAALRFRAMTLVYLVVDCAQYAPFDTHYLPEPFTPVSRISEPKNFRHGDDPEDRTVLCFEIPCERGDEVWQAGSDRLRAIAVDALAGAELPRAPVNDVGVRRLPAVYPVYDLAYAEHLATVMDWIALQPALITLGRQGLFAHDNTHHALEMAWAASDCLSTDGEFDLAGWATALARFANHVVED